MEKIRVSIVIPSKRENSILPKLLNSLVSQIHIHDQIVVADFYMDDEVRSMCKKFKVDCVSGGLPARARNNGAKICHGDLILFLDADIEINNTFIKDAISAFLSSGADVASFCFYAVTGNVFLKVIHYITNYFFRLLTIFGYPHGIGGAIIVKKQFHNDCCGFDETVDVAEDLDYLNRLGKLGSYKLLSTPKIGLSVRRFIDNGIVAMCIKWITIFFHRIIRGEIRNNEILYFYDPILPTVYVNQVFNTKSIYLD